MLDPISLEEKEKYEEIWKYSSYRVNSPGYNAADLFFSFFQKEIKRGDSIIDYGCGTGLATLKFLEKDLTVHLVDIADNALQDKIATLTLLMPDKVTFTEGSLWQLPDSLLPADFAYCMDVLEHIPEEKIDATLEAIAKRTKKGGVFQIFLEDETFGDLIQKKLHLTIKEAPWWKEKLGQYFVVKEMHEIIKGFRIMVFVTPLSTKA